MLKDQKSIEMDLNSDTVVILDRYVPSTLAFQCAKGFDFHKGSNIINIMNIFIPNLTILLDLDPEIAQQRKRLQKNELDKHEEDLILQKKVREQYHKLYKSNMFSQKWILLDSNKNIDLFRKDIINIMEILIKDEGGKYINKSLKPDKCF